MSDRASRLQDRLDLNSPRIQPMKLGVPKETASGETRVAMVPEVVQRLGKSGVDVVVEAGAGAGARIPDEHYTEAGATIGDPYDADVVVKVAPPTEGEIG